MAEQALPFAESETVRLRQEERNVRQRRPRNSNLPTTVLLVAFALREGLDPWLYFGTLRTPQIIAGYLGWRGHVGETPRDRTEQNPSGPRNSDKDTQPYDGWTYHPASCAGPGRAYYSAKQLSVGETVKCACP